MKKTKFLFLSLFLVAALVSCEKDNTDKNIFGSLSPYGASSLAIEGPSTPISLGADGEQGTLDDVTPRIIPGANNGGNRTCAEVAEAFSTPENPVHFDLCGDKIDYNGSFNGEFPEGLDVTVTGGKYVAFEMEDCILIDGKYYKVGAVIVKGSNAANVYFYEDGTFSDSGLSAPLNASGNPAGLSNLTFCFIECNEPPQLIIALKSYVNINPFNSRGEWVVTGGGLANDYFIGCLSFVQGVDFPLYFGGFDTHQAGTLRIGNFDNDPLLEVKITSTTEGMYFTKAFLYIGPVGSCTTDFEAYDNIIIPPASANEVIFDLSF